MQPLEYNKLKMYKGADFVFKFRLSYSGDYVDASNVIFTASDTPGGTEIFNIQSSDSPSFLSKDDDEIWTLRIPASDTAEVEKPELYFQVDTIESGEHPRWIIGRMQVLDNATA